MQSPATPASGGTRVMRVLTLSHPFLFAGALVLERFARTPASVHELTRPLLFSLGIAAFLILVAGIVTRRWPSATYLASLGFVVLAYYPVPALLLAGVGGWWLLIAWLRMRRGRPWPTLTPTSPPSAIAVGYAALLLGFAAWMSVTTTASSPVGGASPAPVGSSAFDGEDIVVLMLDGYPRLDSLMGEFAFDNRSFEAALEELGFEIAGEARANYTKTWLTTASMLAADYVHDLPQVASPPTDLPSQARVAEALINASPVVDSLRADGYEVVSIPSPVRTTDLSDDASVHQVPHLNSLEIALVTTALPSWVVSDTVLDGLAQDAREHASAQVEVFLELAEPADRPRLVMAHLMPPHPPFILGGDLDYLSECFPVCKIWETTVDETGLSEAEYAERVRGQVEELNAIVVEALEEVVATNPEATVIVMSDHGARHHAENHEEHFRIFFAARPGASSVTFPADVSPVNVFRRLLSAGLPDRLADLPYEAWTSDWFRPLILTRHDAEAVR